MAEVTIQQAFALALERFGAGDWAQAENICRQVLAAQPDHADGLHLLGVIANQTGHPADAVELIRRAITINPNTPDSHSNLALALAATGRIDEAIAACEAAIRLDPRFAEAYNNMGQVLHAAGRVDDAADAFRRAIELKPALVEAHMNLGHLLRQRGEVEQSIAAYRSAAAFGPRVPEAHLGLGNALRSANRIDDAIAAFRAALALNPRLVQAQNNLGNALAAQGKQDDAIRVYQSAIQQTPNLAALRVNLGTVFQDQERFDDALACYRAAIAIDANLTEAHYNLGACLRKVSNLPAALEEFQTAVRLDPRHIEARFHVGLTLYELLRIDDVVEACQAAIALDPKHVSSHNCLGQAFKERAQLADAMACYRRATEIEPDYRAAHNNLIYAMHFDPMSDMHAIRREQDAWNRRYADPLKHLIRPHDNDRDPGRRLKIGYVSPNFRHQAEAHFVLPLLESHDHEHFEVYCYSDVARPDNVTAGMRKVADRWHDVRKLSDVELAEKIRADRIDVLIDLTMHMTNDRLLVFAQKPAPIQISWLAYPGSTGLATMDYRLTDNYMDPPDVDDSWSSEKTIRLSDSWCVYSPVSQYPDVSPLPAERAGYVTFGSLNNFCKTNDAVLDRWSRVLSAVPDSHLLLLCPEGESGRRTRSFFQSRGIAPERIDFVFRLHRPQYLEVYHRIDICLDPFPYNGITTTCDALLMGVPVLTLPGPTPPSRAGLSLLTVAGMPEFIATSEAQHIEQATNLANDLPHLAALRSLLRSRMQASPLVDAPRFARAVEAAYRNVWKRWCEST